MKVTLLTRNMKNKAILLFLCMPFVFFAQKNKSTEIKTAKNSINLEVQQHENEIEKKEKFLKTKFFNQQNDFFTTYKNEKLKGTQLFKKEALLVLFILPNSCSSCVETELKRLDELVTAQNNLKNKIIIITSFSTHSSFKAFYNSYKPKAIEMYNQTHIDKTLYGVPVYFTWNNSKVNNIYVPRTTNENLDKQYISKAIFLLEPKTSLNVLFIINGKEIIKPKSYLTEINPNTIESIDIFDETNGLKKYGKKGKNGVYIITTKK